MYRTLILLLFLLSITTPSYAAFPIATNKAAEVNTDQIYQYPFSQTKVPATPYPFSYNKGKSHALAIILCALLGPTGAHNFYLGYWGAGLAQLLMSALAVGIVASATGMGALLLVVPIVLGLGIWLFVELISICVKTKLPKRGDYH